MLNSALKVAPLGLALASMHLAAFGSWPHGSVSRAQSLSPVLRETIHMSKGSFTVETQWTTIQQTSSEVDVLAGRVNFLPKSANSGERCGAVSFIQTARILDNKSKDYEWPTGQSARNKMRTKKNAQGVQRGFFIDHDASRCENPEPECSPFYRDHWPNEENGSKDGSLLGAKSEAAVLVDYPYGWEFISSASLEACAVCRESLEFLGCVTWGGTWPTTGERSLHPFEANENPSKTFEKSLSLFNIFYKK